MNGHNLSTHGTILMRHIMSLAGVVLCWGSLAAPPARANLITDPITVTFRCVATQDHFHFSWLPRGNPPRPPRMQLPARIFI